MIDNVGVISESSGVHVGIIREVTLRVKWGHTEFAELIQSVILAYAMHTSKSSRES